MRCAMEECGPCKFRNEDNKAIKYCLTCEESQCMTCSEIHASSKATKKHLFMAITDLGQSSKTNEDLQRFQNCKDHTEKRLEYFCTDHEHFLCSTCLLNLQDLDCKSIVEVEIAGEQLITTKFNERLFRNLEDVAKYCREQENEMQTMIDKGLSNKEELKIYMNEIKHQIINRFEECEKDILDKIDKTLEKQVTDLQSQQNVLQESRQAATENNNILQNIVSNNSSADIFRCSLSVMEQLNKLPFDNMSTTTEISNHSIELSPILYSLIKSVESNPLMQCKTTKGLQTDKKSFNMIEDKKSLINITKQVAHTRNRKLSNDYNCSSSDADIECCDRISKDITKKDAMTQPTENSNKIYQENASSNASAKEDIDSFFIHVSDSDITTPDSKQPKVVDIVTLPDNSIVLSDSKWLRLLRMKANLTYKDTAELSHAPGKMTVLNKRFLVVCFPTGNRVAFISIHPEFKWMRNFITMHAPRCIQSLEDSRLLVSMKDDSDGKWYLQIVSTDGALKQDIGKKRFIKDATLISSIRLTPTSPRYYLQCCTISNALFCYDVNGKELFKYTVRSPRYLYIDNLLKIYVLDSFGQLHILTNDGTLLQTVNVPTETNGLTCGLPKDTFYLTEQSSAKISVYQVRSTWSTSTAK